MHAVLLAGIQGAGKSTFFRERFEATHVRLNRDMLKTAHRESILLHACLAAQQPFVVDNTNPTVKQRARYRALALAAGFKVELYYFDVSLDAALARNAGRSEAHRVPDVAVRGTLAKLEPPKLDPGWAATYVVRLDPSGGHTVSEYKP